MHKTRKESLTLLFWHIHSWNVMAVGRVPLGVDHVYLKPNWAHTLIHLLSNGVSVILCATTSNTTQYTKARTFVFSECGQFRFNICTFLRRLQILALFRMCVLCAPAGLAGEGERTLIIVKPDGVQRRLVGRIIQRFEQRGFKLVGLKMLQVQKSEISNFGHVSMTYELSC